MGASQSKTSFPGGSPQSERGATRRRSPRSDRPSSSPHADVERVNGRWGSRFSSKRRTKYYASPDDVSSPILSTPGASGDREGGGGGGEAEKGNDNTEGNVQHLTGGDAPFMSSKAAAIMAATEAAEREEKEQESMIANNKVELEETQDELPDRPEEPREQGAAAVARKRREARAAAAMAAAAGKGEDFGLSTSWMIDRASITLGKTIGHSSFGTVCEGRLNGTKVAVKTIKRTGAEDEKTIAKEAEFNCRLRHPNIVLYMGIAMTPTEVCIVTELMARGNVRDLLVPAPGARAVKLEWNIRLQWALDTAQGMAYLHSLTPTMIHRDLKTTNLLVDRGMNVKICDFGMSRLQDADKVMTAVGTVQFAAPEVLKHERYNEKVDLFSYGTVMWELYTRQPVFDKLPQLAVYQAVIGGNMPPVDANCPKEYTEVMHKCWSRNPAHRPSFQDVIECVSALVDAEEEL